MSYRMFLALMSAALSGCNVYESDTADAGFGGVEPVLTEQERKPAPTRWTPPDGKMWYRGEFVDREVVEEKIRAWNEETERIRSRGPEPFVPAEPPKLPGWRNSADSRSAPSSTSRGANKAQCDTALLNAEENLQRYQTLFNQGNVEKGYHGITPSRNTRTRIVRDPLTGRGYEVRESPNLGDAKADERVSCQDAMKRSSRYPQSARKCREYQDKIRKAEIAIRDAQRCIRAARGR